MSLRCQEKREVYFQNESVLGISHYFFLEKSGDYHWVLYRADWTANEKIMSSGRVEEARECLASIKTYSQLSVDRQGTSTCRCLQIRNANNGCLTWTANKLNFNQRVTSWSEIIVVVSNWCQLGFFCHFDPVNMEQFSVSSRSGHP